jgi:hypothetical protein
MSTAPQYTPVSADEYLAGESQSRHKHEFVEGLVYLTIESLKYYLQVEPHQPLVLVDQRLNTGFQQIAYEGLDAVIAFPEFDCSLSLSELYANVDFPDQQKLGEMQEEYGTSG